MDCTLPLWALLFSIATAYVVEAAAPFNLSTITYGEGYSPLFSDFNIERSRDDKIVRLLLNRKSGSGIISTEYYSHGYFSASIKLPSEYTAGIVVAFYTSNVDMFEKNHDELDIEFLGNIRGKPWRFQTNMYGNGSLSRGREESFYLDEMPIREVVRNPAIGGDFPSKPMSLYVTIWDASNWATNGGRNRVNYRYQPFVAEFRDLVLEGCAVDPIEQIPSTNCTDRHAALMAQRYATLTPEQHQSMKWFREKYMYYSYCYDVVRYAAPPPECVFVQSERDMFKSSGRLRERMKFHGSHRKHRRGRSSRRRSHDGIAQI
nr:probable xyloglucan endotransglucosylase/hydrolase protein 30 [Ipomoea batatas]